MKVKAKTIHAVSVLFVSALLIGCLRSHPPTPTPAPPPLGDSIVFISVNQLDGATLEPGKPAHLLIRLEYTLASYDSASLSLNLDQFSDPESCIPRTGEAFATINVSPGGAARIPISRGTHLVELPVTWPGDTGESLAGRVFGEGAVSFQSSMWVDGLNYRFLTQSFGNRYCVRFRKSG